MPLLLLLISCNSSTDLKKDTVDMVSNIRMQAYSEKREVKFHNVFDIFGLSYDDRQVMLKIQGVVTNPNIGKDKNYKTYTDSQFYDLINILGELRVKSIIKSYLEASKIQSNVQKAFEKALNNIYDDKKKLSLQSKLNDIKDGYNLNLKELFNERSVDDVYAKIANNTYMSQVIANANAQLSQLRSHVRGVANDKDVYLQLSANEQDVIDDIKGIVTNPAVAKDYDYETSTDSKFYDLLNTLDILKVREMIEAYLREARKRAEKYAEVKSIIDSIEDSVLREKLQKLLDDKHDLYKVTLKRIFNSSNSDFIYQEVVHGDYIPLFGDFRDDIAGIKNFEDIYKGLSSDEQALIEDIRSNDTERSKLKFKALLGRLGSKAISEIIAFHLNVLQEKEAAKSVLGNVPKGDEKEDLVQQFERYVYNYDLHLEWCFQDSNPYNRIKNSKYASNFTKIKEEALKLTPVNEVGNADGDLHIKDNK